MRSVSYLRNSILEKNDDTLSIKISTFNEHTNSEIYNDCIMSEPIRDTLRKTLEDKEFVEDNCLKKLRDIYLIDQYCNIHVHIINNEGIELKNGLVATIRIQ